MSYQTQWHWCLTFAVLFLLAAVIVVLWTVPQLLELVA